MVENPRQAYGALLVMIAAGVSAVVIFSGFVAPEYVFQGDFFLVYIGAVGVMLVCAVVSWLVDLAGILSREFGANGGEH